jgi:hypothetical protein
MAAGIRVGLASRFLWNEHRKIKRVNAEGRGAEQRGCGEIVIGLSLQRWMEMR